MYHLRKFWDGIKMVLRIFSMILIHLFFVINVSAQDKVISYIPPSFENEQPAIGPSSIVSVDSKVLIIDGVDNELLVFSDPTLLSILTTYNMPNNFGILEETRVLQNTITLTSQSKVVFTIPADLILSGNSLINEADNKRELYGSRVNSRIEFSLSDENEGAKKNIATVVPTLPNAEIIDWKLISIDENEVTVHWNELSGKALIGVVSKFNDGKVVSRAFIDWSQYEYIPENPIVADKEGNVYVIAKKEDAWSRKLVFEKVSQQDEASSIPNLDFGEFFKTKQQPGIQYYKNFETSVPVESNNAPNAYELLDEAMLEYKGINSNSLMISSPVKRSLVISRALQYQSVPWFYRNRNHTYQGSNWERPNRLEGKVGTWVNGFPYKWGGYQDVNSFLKGVISGKTAGDVETDVVLSKNKVVGCDCSGCLSAWWGMRRLATSHIPNVSETKEILISEMRPGDIFNKAGSHVRMLLNKIGTTSSGIKYRIIESSVSCGGVCIRKMSPTSFANYTPYTYNNFAD